DVLATGVLPIVVVDLRTVIVARRRVAVRVLAVIVRLWPVAVSRRAVIGVGIGGCRPQKSAGRKPRSGAAPAPSARPCLRRCRQRACKPAGQGDRDGALNNAHGRISVVTSKIAPRQPTRRSGRRSAADRPDDARRPTSHSISVDGTGPDQSAGQARSSSSL